MSVIVIDGAVVNRVVALQGPAGPAGPAGPLAAAFRGLAFRTTTGSVDFTGVTIGDYINIGLTGTLDAAVSVDVAAAGANKFGLKRTAEGKAWCQVIATADVAGASNKRISIQLAVNGVPVAESQCDITITPTTIGKLHSMYLFELDENDEVTVFIANKSNQQTISIERARMTLFAVS
jgi:hypothetical protein